jgi:hypothetical protein
VFINCPFDEQYSALFHAAVFAVMDCGFHIRCALDTSDSGQIRLNKIYSTIAACKLAIHDLSRVQLSERTGLPRFNMPLELGIFLGAKLFGDTDQQSKMCIVFDEEPYRYQQYLSDVAGQDISVHHNNSQTLVTKIRDWLASVSTETLPSGSKIWERYQRFQNELHASCRAVKQKPEELTYHDYLMHVDKFRAVKYDTLILAHGEPINDPSASDIKRAIKSLEGGRDSFVIYGRSGSGLTYMQALGGPVEGFILEYQQGSLDEHYRCLGRVPQADTIDAFQAYAVSNKGWKENFPWVKVELDV